MVRMHWKEAKDKVIAEIRKLKQDKTLLQEHQTAIDNAVNSVRLFLTDFKNVDIDVPKTLHADLAKKLKEDIGEYIIQERLIDDIKKRLNDLLKDILVIAHHLKALTEGSELAIQHIDDGNITSLNLHKFAAEFTKDLNKLKDHAKSHNLKQIKRAILDIEKVVQEFDELQSRKGKEYGIAIDIGKLMQKYTREVQAEWNATVRARGALSHFSNLKTSLKELLLIIFGVHDELRGDKRFMRQLRHLKP
ncbi:hypothetical protein KY361_07475 [Candidatus Woesearchaeota archaeon]|nr:hypothetical protein [Candidatus Woesearchaeota archaeon]